MKNWIKLKSLLNKEKEETNYVRNLFYIMQDVGGYSELMEMTLPAVSEALKAKDYIEKQKAKSVKGGKKK